MGPKCLLNLFTSGGCMYQEMDRLISIYSDVKIRKPEDWLEGFTAGLRTYQGSPVELKNVSRVLEVSSSLFQ